MIGRNKPYRLPDLTFAGLKKPDLAPNSVVSRLGNVVTWCGLQAWKGSQTALIHLEAPGLAMHLSFMTRWDLGDTDQVEDPGRRTGGAGKKQGRSKSHIHLAQLALSYLLLLTLLRVSLAKIPPHTPHLLLVRGSRVGAGDHACHSTQTKRWIRDTFSSRVIQAPSPKPCTQATEHPPARGRLGPG